MRDILRDTKSTVVYDPTQRIKDGRGAKSKLDDLTPQAEDVYNATESGMSLGSTVVLLNQWRRAQKLGSIGYGTLQRLVADSPVMKLGKTQMIKSGSSDEGSDWAGGRLGFASQVKRQLVKGLRIQGKGPEYDPAADDES